MEFSDLYTWMASLREPTLVEVAPFMVNDTCPLEEEITVVVWRLRANKAPDHWGCGAITSRGG
jgi:hypothetical protein